MKTTLKRRFALHLVSACYLLLALSESLAAVQQVRFDEGFPLIVEEVSIVGATQDLGITMDAALGPDGSIYVADMGSMQIVAFDQFGDLAWRSGGSGDGPGEFRALYRLAVASDGRIYAFDPSANAVSRFSPAGSFIDRRQLEFGFSKMDDLVVGPGSRMAIAGITPRGPAPDSAIHVFDSELQYINSYAPAPVAMNPMSLSYSGAGTIALTPEGRSLFVRRLPYEIYEYSLEGRRVNFIEAPFSYDLTPDDVVTINEGAGRFEISRPTKDVPAFHAATSLTDSTFIVSRREGTARYWDLFTRSGSHVASTEVPNDWGVIVGYDRARNVLWVLGRHQLEPVLHRLRLDPTSL